IYVENSSEGGGTDLGWTTAEMSPREELTTCLTQSLERDAWQRRRTQWLNPRLATSFIAGWRDLPGGVFMRDTQGNIVSPLLLSEWIGEWEDTHGNVVRYSLMESRYRDTAHNQVRCYAQYVTAAAIGY